MKKKLLFISVLFLGALSLVSCDSSDDPQSNIIVPKEIDEECCNAEETFLAYTFLNNGYLKEIESLRDTIDGKYALKAYSRGGRLTVGYNDVFFALIKISTGGYVRDFSVTDITPLMTMTAMGMKHSTPLLTEAEQYDESFPAVRRAWVSFLMASGESGYWQLSYKLTSQAGTLVHDATLLTIEPQTSGTSTLKSFKVGSDTYYITLQTTDAFQQGSNTVRAYISKKATDTTKPYPLATEQFTIEIYPTMPDMGNHTSPGNEPLTLQSDGSYVGKLNLSMTGLWDIHLNVKDANGNTVAGGEELSTLYLTVTL